MELREEFPEVYWDTQSGGISLPDSTVARLESAWRTITSHLAVRTEGSVKPKLFHFVPGAQLRVSTNDGADATEVTIADRHGTLGYATKSSEWLALTLLEIYEDSETRLEARRADGRQIRFQSE